VFKAFERVCGLSEPVLVFVISNGTVNLDGLYKGARDAAISNHRVVIAILSQFGTHSPIKRLSGLERFGVRISEHAPQQISGVLGVEIPAMSRNRSVRQLDSR
jgi:hypothetical protein